MVDENTINKDSQSGFEPQESTAQDKPTPQLVWALLVLLAAVLGGTLWYGSRADKQAGPVFDPARQVIPQGTRPLAVDQVFATFGFSKPLPFFDERNVVQVLDLRQSTSTMTAPSPFLSYRVAGQDIDALRAMFIAYFKEMGWREIRAGIAATDRLDLFFAVPPADNDPSKMVRVSLLEGLDRDQRSTTIVLSFFSRRANAPATTR